MSVEDQNLNLLVRDKEGREGEEEEEGEEGEGRSFSWLLLRRKQNRFWEGAEIKEKKIKKMVKQYEVKKKTQLVKVSVTSICNQQHHHARKPRENKPEKQNSVAK